jgi:hypothetical protein
LKNVQGFDARGWRNFHSENTGYAEKGGFGHWSSMFTLSLDRRPERNQGGFTGMSIQNFDDAE